MWTEFANSLIVAVLPITNANLWHWTVKLICTPLSCFLWRNFCHKHSLGNGILVPVFFFFKFTTMLLLLVQFSFGYSQKILWLNHLIYRLFWSTISCSKVRSIVFQFLHCFFFFCGVFPLNNIKPVKQEKIWLLLIKKAKEGILFIGNFATLLYIWLVKPLGHILMLD